MSLQKKGMGRPSASFWLPAVFIVLLLLALLASRFFFSDLRDTCLRESRDDIAAVATLRAYQIQALLADRQADVRTLSDDSFFSREARLWMRGGARDDARQVLLDKHLRAFLENHRLRAIVLYDAAGRAVLDVGNSVPEGRQMSDAAQGVLASGRISFIDLQRHQDPTQSVTLGFMSPLRDGVSPFGVVYLVADPEQDLFPLLREWPGDRDTAETQLARQEGDRVVYLTHLHHRPEQPLAFSLPLDTPQLAAAQALRGKLGAQGRTLDYSGKPVLSHAIAIPGTPWVLIAKIDEEEASRHVDRMQRVTTLLAIAVFGVLAFGLLYWQQRVRKALESVIDGVRAQTGSLLKEAEKRCRMLFEQAALPMMRCTLPGEIVEVNDAWCELFRYSREEIAAQHLSWQRLTHPDDLESGLTMVRQMVEGKIDGFRFEKRYFRKDGKMVWGAVQVGLFRDASGNAESFVTTIHDITGRKQAELQISFMAYHDKLTGLPNRALLFDRLSQAMSQAKRDGKNVALLFIDLDGFKGVNDRYGHEAGDAVLRMAAQRFLACVRAVDTVARFGGDEFAIVLGNLDDPQQARGVARKIIEAFAQGMSLPEGQECHVGASVGISIFPEHGSAMDSLITAADRAMYECKHRGPNNYGFFRETAPAGEDTQWLKLEDKHHLGIREIDEQHRNLAYLVNRLNASVKRNEAAEATLQVLDELLAATARHFETESRLMTQYRYPEQAQHEEEHAQLLADAQQFKQQFSEGRELLVLQSVKDWLLAHMAYTDKRLAVYLLQQGVK